MPTAFEYPRTVPTSAKYLSKGRVIVVDTEPGDVTHQEAIVVDVVFNGWGEVTAHVADVDGTYKLKYRQNSLVFVRA